MAANDGRTGRGACRTAPARGAKSRRHHDARAVTIAPGASISQACRLLHDHNLRRLPVIDGDKLVGMIARADLVRAVAVSAEKASPAPTRDVSVAERQAELERQIWRDRARIIRPF